MLEFTVHLPTWLEKLFNQFQFQVQFQATAASRLREYDNKTASGKNVLATVASFHWSLTRCACLLAYFAGFARKWRRTDVRERAYLRLKISRASWSLLIDPPQRQSLGVAFVVVWAASKCESLCPASRIIALEISNITAKSFVVCCGDNHRRLNLLVRLSDNFVVCCSIASRSRII